MKLIIIRHGETAWTLTGQLTGASDVPLTAHGRRQATALREIVGRLVALGSPIVFSSPRTRALDTARLALPGEEITVEPLLEEFGYGLYEGLTPTQVREREPGWDIWHDGCLEGELMSEVAARADRFLQLRVGESDDALVIAVTHGHFSRILAARALGLSGDQGRLFASATASVSVVEDYHGERCLGLWNASSDVLYGPYQG
jgi:probable phosphoglycerate mutase